MLAASLFLRKRGISIRWKKLSLSESLTQTAACSRPSWTPFRRKRQRSSTSLLLLPLCCSSANWKSAPLTGKPFWRERKSASTTGNMPCSTVWLRHLAASTPENNFMRRPGTRYIPMGQIPWKTLSSGYDRK